MTNMNMDIDGLLKKDAFRNITPEQAAMIRELSGKLEGKGTTEALPVLMEYSKKAGAGRVFTKDETAAMLAAFMETMPEEQRDKLHKILRMFNL